jgi:archaellum biogenesis protein FlaJ (TadC family)
MTSTSGHRTQGPNVVRLPTEPIVAEPEPRPKRLSRIHSLATVGMALCAFLGIFSLLALITVRWPGDTNRFVVGLLIFAGFGFLLCGSLAMFSAARDTYVQGSAALHDEQE